VVENALIKWLLALAFSTCGRQIARMDLSNFVSPERDIKYLSSGQSWRDAFGEVLVVDLVTGFDTVWAGVVDFESHKSVPRDVLSHFLLEGRKKDVATSFEIVACELGELMLTIGAERYVIYEEFLAVQGTCTLAVQVGRARSLGVDVWHICSAEETCLFLNVIADFISLIRALRVNIAKINGLGFYRFNGLDEPWDPYSEMLIFVM
jgi:hypothetical protein